VSTPVIIEAAINGATPKTANPNVPVTEDEIVADALACFEAGAAIVHQHISSFNVSGDEAAEVYLGIWRRVLNVVRPGRILTEKWEGVLGEDGLFWSHYQNIQLLKCHGRAEDVAAAVAFLGSDEAAFIPAAVLDVDGGAVAKL
jgi:hypothetical protein